MKIRELYSDASRWTQYATARDEYGTATHIFNEEAYSYCLYGALYKCYSGQNTRKIESLLMNRASRFLGQWNDDKDRTFEEVKALVEELDI